MIKPCIEHPHFPCCRLRVFENRVLRRIFGLKRDEIAGA
jgi:hypothetical protein